MAASGRLYAIAQRTPAKPTSRFRSLSVSCCALFLKRGSACSQRPPLARFSPCWAADAEPPAGCALGVWADRLPIRPTRRRVEMATVESDLGIKKRADVIDACPNHTAVS